MLYYCYVFCQSQIQFRNRFRLSVPGQTCFVSLDATDCSIQEPKPFDQKWFSHKLNGPGLKYEVGLCIRSGDIVWIHGGVPCGEYSDLVLARDLYIYAVDQGEKTIADEGYNDGNYFIYPESDPPSGAMQKRIMARHETVNSRLKQFGVLSKSFRHNIDYHSLCFTAVAVIVQLMIANGGEPLFSVAQMIV